MQVVVITGIAQGMGRETAKLLAADGYAIAGFDVDAKGIKSLRAELPGDSLLATLDVTDVAGINTFRDKVLKKFGHVDTVLSNVGIGFFGAFEEVDLAKAAKCLEINVIGTAAIFQAFVPHMRERRAGKLIAVSSLVGQIPFPFESIYSASKFAVEGLVLSMRLELAPFGIKTALIQPAQVSTSFAAKIHNLPPETSPYYDRISRFIHKDEELIKTAPSPLEAAKSIAAVVKNPNPSLHNQIDAKSKFFMNLNKVLPTKVRDMILLDMMDIK